MLRWLIIFAGALAALFHRLFIGEVFYWGLPSLQFVPWRQFALEQLRAGILPLWNPYNGAGTPLFANYQSALMYPFNWASFFAPDVRSLALVMSFTAVAHLVIAGYGMWFLTKRLGFSPFGSAVSALAFALSGYLVARLGTYPMISTAAWLPWMLITVRGLITRGTLRDVGLLAGCTALLLTAGHAQTAWYSLLLTGVFSVWWIARFYLFDREKRPRPSAKKLERAAMRLAGTVGAILLGSGIASLQLAATAELLGESQRSSGAEYSFAVNFSYAPARTLNIISPNVFGTPADGSYLTEGAYFEDAVYIGFIPLISAIMAVIAWRRRRLLNGKARQWAIVPFALAIVIAGYLLALGQYSPVFPFFYNNVPTFDLFQAPVRWHLWTVFGLSLLAGIGVEAWGRDFVTRKAARWGVVGGIGALLAALLGMLIFSGSGEGVNVLVRAVFATAVLGVIASLLTLRQPQPETGAHWRWQGLVLVVIAVDLVWTSWGLNPTLPGSIYERDTTESTDRTYVPDEESIRYEQLFTFDNYHLSDEQLELLRESPLANLNLLSRQEVFSNFDPLLIDHYRSYQSLLETTFSPVLTTWAGIENAEAESVSRTWLIPYDAICWHESEFDLAADLNAGALEGTLTAGVAHMAGDGGCPETSSVMIGTARITEDTGNRVTIMVNTDQLAWLILPDIDYPGWRAYVDDRPVPVYRVNLAFRAVQVDDGTHEVVFAYGPPWLLPGVLITLLCTILLVVLIQVREFNPS